MHDSQKESNQGHEDDARKALDQHEEGIEAMRARADETAFDTAKDRDMSLLSSGFVYGWTKAAAFYESSGLTSSHLFRLAREGVEALDQFLLQDASVSVLEKHRNNVAGYLVDLRSAAEGKVYADLRMYYGMQAASVLRMRGEISDQHAFDVGVAVHAKNPMFLFGFALYREDPRLRCKCLSCFTSQLGKDSVEEEAAERMLLQKFTDRYSAILSLGRWFHATAAREIDSGLDSIVSSYTSPVDSSAAAEISHSLLDSLRFGGKK